MVVLVVWEESVPDVRVRRRRPNPALLLSGTAGGGGTSGSKGWALVVRGAEGDGDGHEYIWRAQWQIALMSTKTGLEDDESKTAEVVVVHHHGRTGRAHGRFLISMFHGV